jgi:dihydroorotate dehydrogenase
MDKKTFQTMIASIKAEGFQGAILSNTHRVDWPQAGGQSGHPLLSPSNACLEWAWDVTKGSLPIIASGGVLSGVDAFHKLARGACAVQIYTALVYRGPGAVLSICEELAAELKLRGFNSAQEAIGSYYL